MRGKFVGPERVDDALVNTDSMSGAHSVHPEALGPSSRAGEKVDELGPVDANQNG